MVLCVPRGSHHHIVNFLLRMSCRWWVVTNIVSLVPRVLFDKDVISVQFSVLSQLSSLKSVSLSSCWNSILHPREVFLKVHWSGFIPFDIDIFNWIMSGESPESPKRVYS